MFFLYEFMKILNYAPILIPTLNRYEHIRRCVESLSRCTHADKTELVIGLDFPPSEKYIERWKRIDAYLAGKEHDEFFEQPVVDLFFKKEGSPDFSPYCTVILYIFNSIFIYTLPYCDIDGERFASDRALKSHFSLFKSKQYLHVPEWEEFDANDRTVGNPIYKIPVIPTGVNYKVEFRPSDDEVFEIKRK